MARKTVRKVITSPELIEKINPENKKLAIRFLRDKSSRSSDLTISNYDSDLNIFFVWNLLYNDNKFFVELKKIELSEFFSYAIEELGWSSARFGRMRSVLSSFSSFIERYYDEEYKDFRNIVLKAVDSMPKNPAREKTILTESQIKMIFDHFLQKNDLQICCWLALAIGSGSRFSELLRFTTTIIDLNHTVFEGLFLETAKPIKTKGRTKQGKMLKKYIIKDIFVPYYNMWLESRGKIMSDNNVKHDFIFIKNNGHPAEEGTARGWVRKIEEFLGVPFYPHCLRHYSTTYLSKSGLPYNLIQELFGWESSNMVNLYDDSSAKDREWKELEKLKVALSNKE